MKNNSDFYDKNVPKYKDNKNVVVRCMESVTNNFDVINDIYHKYKSVFRIYNFDMKSIEEYYLTKAALFLNECRGNLNEVN